MLHTKCAETERAHENDSCFCDENRKNDGVARF